jgi:aldose 1-epimerase
MPIITLENDLLQLETLPEAGASIVSLAGRLDGHWVPLMRPTPPDAVATLNSARMASFNLVPWSNRIQNAQFHFQGRRYDLRCNTEQGYAIHGDARGRPWQVTEQDAAHVTCALDSRDWPDFNFPFPLTIEICYELAGNAFDTTLKLTNAGDAPMPAGFGFHPYFNRAFGDHGADVAQLQLAVAGVYPPMPGGPMLPVPPEQDFTRLTPIGARVIDHCFGGWDGRATIAYPGAGVQLEFECEPALGHVILYSPAGKSFFAVEPVTHANNGFNLFADGQPGTGIQVIEPGQTLSGRFRIRVTGQK